MNSGMYLFSQLMASLPKRDFDRCVRKYNGNYRIRRFSCFDQFLCMAFAQLTFRDSLRDIEVGLNSVKPKLYHLGFRGNIARNTLAKANQNRDWRIFADFANILIAHARQLYIHDPIGVRMKNTVYAFDSTTVDLCLTFFSWAKFRKRKAAVKLHTLIDLRGNIPCFIHISQGKLHDVNALDHLPIEAGAYYVMDRGYIDFARLYCFHKGMAYFVTRAKINMTFRVLKSQRVDKTTGLRCDQIIQLTGTGSVSDYPQTLRRVKYVDKETGRTLVFLTNNFELAAITIAKLYKCRWRVELFFKWIKQHLRIKTFFGTSENAVKTQVWIAVCVYVLVAIVKKEYGIDRSMTEILQILSLHLFEKIELFSTLSSKIEATTNEPCHNPLPLFDF